MGASKTVYFSDYPSTGSNRSGLTIPFSEDDANLYSRVVHLSSLSLRRLLGYNAFSRLEADARNAGRPVASFARDVLAQQIARGPATRPTDDNSLQATFKGGQGSPLHDWYPYLEGYSPAFVQSIIRTYAPDAATILDPFCGSGTTVLVAAAMGRRGLFAEVNPVCRFVIETKSRALALSEAERASVIDGLHELLPRLGTILGRAAPDRALRARQNAALGPRPYFDEKTGLQVLKLRTLLNVIELEQPLLAPFVTIAALRSLVPASLLMRRGDLRFRTEKEMAAFHPDLVAELRDSIELIASDLTDLLPVAGNVSCACPNARELAANVDAPIDAIITSPPYLNGTNYFRNTKIELCFLGYLAAPADLRAFRDAAITAGINDVTVAKTGTLAQGGTAKLAATLQKLGQSAYDVRIPAMVQSYFQEMEEVACNLKAVVKVGGVAAIDLGDSCYGGIHVPTDELVAEQMARHGFERQDRVVLRERQSRDGGRLAQTLQVFERRDPSSGRSAGADGELAAWKRFRRDLPHQSGDMAKRNWGHAWHSLCSYQGKLKPSIASTLVAALLKEGGGGRLLDPFAGVGTIPFEARLQGHTAYGFDISPAAARISEAKLLPVSADAVAECVGKLKRFIGRPSTRRLDQAALDRIRFNGPLSTYFHADTLGEIVAARRYFAAHPPSTGSQALVMASLLHVLHGNRPYALSRRSHPITPFAPTGPVEYRPLLGRLQAKLDRALAALPPAGVPDGRLFEADATAVWPDEVDRLDAIVTSPPFFDSTRFHTANWMRLWFAGWDAADFAAEPGRFLDERQKLDMAVYEPIFAQARERLRPGGLMALHLGKSRKRDMAADLSILGARHLDLVDQFSEAVDHCESHGFKDKGTVTHHQYLLFRRA